MVYIGYSAVSTQKFKLVDLYVLSAEVLRSIDDIGRIRHDELTVRLS